MKWKATQLWMAAPPKRLFFFETDGLKHHPFGVSGMRPFMDGIIENKVGNSLDSSLENRERERDIGVIGDSESSTWQSQRLRFGNLYVYSSQTRELMTFPIFSYHSLTFSTWHLQHFFNPKYFPHLSYVYCRCSFSFLTSHIQTQTTFHLVVSPRDLGTAPTKRGSQAIGRNEFAFYFRSLVSKNRLKIGHSKTDGPRQLPIQLPKMVKCEDACLEILPKKQQQKRHVFFYY